MLSLLLEKTKAEAKAQIQEYQEYFTENQEKNPGIVENQEKSEKSQGT